MVVSPFYNIVKKILHSAHRFDLIVGIFWEILMLLYRVNKALPHCINLILLWNKLYIEVVLRILDLFIQSPLQHRRENGRCAASQSQVQRLQLDDRSVLGY